MIKKVIFSILTVIFIGFLCYNLYFYLSQLFYDYYITAVTDYPDFFLAKSLMERKEQYQRIIFVGDIMFDRGVEYLMEKNDFLYPVEKISVFLKDSSIVFANLEGPIVKNPPYFTDNSLKFAFSSKILETIISGSFNLLSLANNHILNMGREGFEETKNLLSQANIDFLGDSVYCDFNLHLQKDGIVFFAVNKTFPFNCIDEEIVKQVRELRNLYPDNFLVVSLHWGQEYKLKSSIFQQELARKIIDSGADLIIGHHPHVVQEIEIYKGKLIFYSLGNFIFDQFFSEETQRGLLVELKVYPQKILYYFHPIESSFSQPALMDGKEKAEFLEKLAERSSSEILNSIRSGFLEILQ